MYHPIEKEREKSRGLSLPCMYRVRNKLPEKERKSHTDDYDKEVMVCVQIEELNRSQNITQNFSESHSNENNNNNESEKKPSIFRLACIYSNMNILRFSHMCSNEQ